MPVKLDEKDLAILGLIQEDSQLNCLLRCLVQGLCELYCFLPNVKNLQQLTYKNWIQEIQKFGETKVLFFPLWEGMKKLFKRQKKLLKLIQLTKMQFGNETHSFEIIENHQTPTQNSFMMSHYQTNFMRSPSYDGDCTMKKPVDCVHYFDGYIWLLGVGVDNNSDGGSLM